MQIKDVPEGHWMILDEEHKVIYHSEDLKIVVEEVKKRDVNKITIQRKFTGLIF
jgi:hypothetical protein